MSDSIDDIDDEEDEPDYEWVALHYPACAICSATDMLPGPMVAMPAQGHDKVPGKFIRFMTVVCQSCGYTIFVAAKSVEPKPLPEGGEDA